MKVKNILSVFLLWLLSINIALSQSRKTYKVNPGEVITEALPHDVLYKYNQFINGTVHFRNGALGGGRMNFNNLLGKIQFIDDKNDTLELNNEPPIRYVNIAADTFYFEKNWMQVAHSGSNILLTKLVMLGLSNRQRKGAMGVVSEGTVNPVTQLSFDSRALRELPTNEILTFAFYTEYFAGDRFGHFKPANKKGFLSLFGTNNKQIEAYFGEHPVDFSNEDDLLRLTGYIDQLF
jgi:hypothetical protein